jgi:hypothetical protein
MPKPPTKKQLQKPLVDERARDKATGRGVLRGSMGRLALDPTLGPRIVALLERGWSLATAASACGVPERSLMHWLARGRAKNEETDTVDADDVFAVFADSVDRAIGTFLGKVEEAVAKPGDDSDGDGRIDAALATNRRWILEKRLAVLYGKKVEHVVRVNAMEWVIEALEQAANNGTLSRGALHEVLRCLVETGEESAAGLH